MMSKLDGDLHPLEILIEEEVVDQEQDIIDIMERMKMRVNMKNIPFRRDPTVQINKRTRWNPFRYAPFQLYFEGVVLVEVSGMI